MKLDAKKLRLLLFGFLGLLGILFFVVLFIGISALSSKSQQMTSLKLQGKVLDYQITSLTEAKKQVKQYSYVKTVAAEIIPNDKDQAQAVLEIFQLADQAGIDIASITFPQSTLGGPTGDATTASSAALLSQAKPVSGIKGLYSIQLTIASQSQSQVPTARPVTYDKMLDFLDHLERNERTAQITSVDITPDAPPAGSTAPSNGISFQLMLNIFIKP